MDPEFYTWPLQRLPSLLPRSLRLSLGRSAGCCGPGEDVGEQATLIAQARIVCLPNMFILHSINIYEAFLMCRAPGREIWGN